jgi:hypothetical protein
LLAVERSATTAPTLTRPDARGNGRPPSGLAHVATASFLASRASPSAGYWIALPGGVALARAGEDRGLRQGYGVSIAAMLQTVAVMGPARFGVPLTQALTAPLLGLLHGRGTSVVRQVLACAAIRLTHTTLTVAFFALVLAGGIDSYTDSYDAIAGKLPLLPEGTTAALVVTAVSLLFWAAFASIVQVMVYRRGLHLWRSGIPDSREREAEQPAHRRRRFDPRAIALAAAIAFGLLLASTAWPVLAAVSAWLALAWIASGGDRDVVPAGLAIALLLAVSILIFALIGGQGVDEALRRSARAGLLVLVATWLRAAAGSDGLRELSRRLLGRLRRLPSAREASLVLDDLGSGRQLGAAAQSALAVLRATPKRPLVFMDAVLGWVTAEAVRFRAAAPAPAAALSLRVLDVALVALAALPVLALLA